MLELAMKWLMNRAMNLTEYGDEGKEVADVAVQAVVFAKNPTQATARKLQLEFKQAVNALIPLLPKE